MQTLTQTLETALTRRARNIAALSGERFGAHTLDTIAECDGRIAEPGKAPTCPACNAKRAGGEG